MRLQHHSLARNIFHVPNMKCFAAIISKILSRAQMTLRVEYNLALSLRFQRMQIFLTAIRAMLSPQWTPWLTRKLSLADFFLSFFSHLTLVSSSFFSLCNQVFPAKTRLSNWRSRRRQRRIRNTKYNARTRFGLLRYIFDSKSIAVAAYRGGIQYLLPTAIENDWLVSGKVKTVHQWVWLWICWCVFFI